MVFTNVLPHSALGLAQIFTTSKSKSFSKLIIRPQSLGTALLLAIIVSEATNAQWVHINFDDGLGDLVVINDFYSPLGITFQNAAWRKFPLPGYSPPFTLVSTNTPSGSQYGQDQAIVGLFSNSVDWILIRGLDIGSAGGRIDVYDATIGGNLIGTQQAFGSGLGQGSITDFSISVEGIRRFELYQPAFNLPAGDGLLWDNLSFHVTLASIIQSYVNHSVYSGTGSSIDTSKVLAKESIEPQLLTYDNLINTAQGINGIVFDIENLPDEDTLSAEDFEFQVSPQGAFVADDHPPANWQEAPDPSSITVTPGSPDRVLIQWPDGSIMNRWLRITVLANEETGLAQPETYYIGHLLGETTGPDNGMFTVSFADITPIRAEVGQTVDASSITDIDKSGTVSFADISAMRGNVGAQLTQISVP